MRITIFVLEMILGVLPASVMAPIAILGSLMGVIGSADDWRNIFHPIGLLGILGLAGMVGLWFVVPQNAFKKNFTPDKVHLTLLGLGMLSALPIAYIYTFMVPPEEPRDLYIIFCFFGPIAIASKYLCLAYKRKSI